VCCCLSFLDFDLDLSLFLQFGFYRSHLFTNFRFSTVFISRSGAHRLDSSWLSVFFIFRGSVLVLGVSRSRLAASFRSMSASSGFLRLSLCLWFESFLLRTRKARRLEPRSDLRLVARSTSLVPVPLSYELIWLPPVTALHRFSLLLIRFSGRTDRVSSCTISSSKRLLGFSVEILLPQGWTSRSPVFGPRVLSWFILFH
jgi:hypothetical protein